MKRRPTILSVVLRDIKRPRISWRCCRILSTRMPDCSATGTMVVGSGLTIAYLLYRRGFNGFGSAAEVPASYFSKRKRIRIRIASVAPLTTRPRNPSSATGIDGYSPLLHGEGGGTGDPSYRSSLSDVVLFAEHITFLRRLFRLSPRSLLLREGLREQNMIAIRLCGISANSEGLRWIEEELVRPFQAQYAYAEFLLREDRILGSHLKTLGGDQATTLVAVCHLHCKRKLFAWNKRDVGVGEVMPSKGLGKLRKEQWVEHYSTEDMIEEEEVKGYTKVSLDSIKSESPAESFPMVDSIKGDFVRLAAVEEGARAQGRGLWAEGNGYREVQDPVGSTVFQGLAAVFSLASRLWNRIFR
ncbi:unnamed protein product [Choristocarpus tenellus]